ncbi:MAG: alpha/beta fold hydrolase [Halieaceae bacterium]|nr:alpha/beta fold hydrolase [Halieaceae bacterium]
MKSTLIAVTLGLLALTSCATYSAREPNPYDRFRVGDSYLSDFYLFDEAVPNEPGRLLRQETLSEKQKLAQAATNIRLLYSSTNGLTGQGTLPVSGALFLPKGEAPEGGWPLMAWTHGTVGIADVCAPSWNGRQAQDEEYLNRYLARGYAVVASDYQGLGTKGTHPYLHTRAAAYSNLDIIRAVQGAGFPVSNRTVLFGQSQGAAAAIATADYAPDYAPEIELVGIVATGAPYFTPAALDALDRIRKPEDVDPMLGYTFLAMTLAQQVDSSFTIRDYVADAAWPVAERVDDTCYADIKQMVTEAQLSRANSFAQNPREILRTAFAAMGYPDLKLSAPVFFGTGGQDKDTPPRMQAGLVMALCRAGTVVYSKLYPSLDHRGVVLPSSVDSIPFVAAAFASEEISGNCDDLPVNGNKVPVSHLRLKRGLG